MWSIFFVFVLTSCTYALNDAEMKAFFVKRAFKCLKTNPVEMPDLLKLDKYIVPDKPEAKCLLACIYKEDGTINEKGMYDLEIAYKTAELAKDGDEKRLENGKKIADLCSKINDVEVSDGEKGCERATLLFKCMTENARKFGFKL